MQTKNIKKICLFMSFIFILSMVLNFVPILKSTSSDTELAETVIVIDASDTKNLLMLNAETLQVVNELDLNSYDFGTLSFIQCYGSKVYVLSQTYDFFIIDIDTFTVDYFFEEENDKFKNFLVDDDFIYSMNGTVIYKSDALTGETIITNVITTFVTSNAVVSYMSSYGLYLYVVSGSLLTSVLKSDLTVVAQSVIPVAVTYPYILKAYDYGVFVSNGSRINVYNRNDLSLNWTLYSGGSTTYWLCLYYQDGELYLAKTTSSTINVYDVSDRNILRSTVLSYLAYSLKADSDNFYIIDSTGTLRKFNKDDMINTRGYANAGFNNMGLSYNEISDTSYPCGYFGCGNDLTIGSSIPTGGEYKRYGLEKYLAGYYKFGTTVTLKNISLTVFSVMTQPIMENIQCKVNEHSLGIPDSICTVGTHSVITWNDEIFIDAPFVIFSFYNSVSFSGGKYWGVPVTPDDINGDGIIKWYNYGWDYLWNEHFQAYPEIRSYPIDNDKELYIRFCASYDFDVDCMSDLEETLIVQPSIICTNEPIEIIYSLLADDFCTGKECIIYINKSGAIMDTLTLDKQQSKLIYYANETGKYFFNMTVNDELKLSKTVLINCETTNYLKSIPNPSTPFQTVTIYYGYDSVLQGKIDIVKLSGESGDEIILKTITISPSLNGSFNYAFQTNGIYYIRLYVNSTEYLLKELVHYVGETGFTFLTSNKQIYTLGESIVLSYQHNYIGENVYISYSTGEIIKHIGDSSTGKITIKANESGFFSVWLLLKRGDGFPSIKAKCSFTVIEPQPAFGMVIESPWSWFLGIFICVFFMLIPFFIKSIFKLTDDIPMLFYIITTCVGVVISVIFGFFPIWVPFFILFIAILIIVIMWMKGKTGINSE